LRQQQEKQSGLDSQVNLLHFHRFYELKTDTHHGQSRASLLWSLNPIIPTGVKTSVENDDDELLLRKEQQQR
jgi:hypothetical protein